MDKRLEKIMKESLGVTVADVERMNRKEMHELYEKAMTNEEVKAVKACKETKEGWSQEAEDAAHIVDWLWKKSEKFRAA